MTVSEAQPLAKSKQRVADHGASLLAANVVQGDALTMTFSHGPPITFPEWGYLNQIAEAAA